jgi:CheY-like chemotaxis protein/predicted regulator of Ras-like GTPase activity (Roadblock/LC7/MglB family)
MQKVLVVDDSLSVRKVVEKALEGRGLQVLAAASGAEAIQMIDRDRPDVVICDVILPDKDGYQICQYVRAHPAIGATPVLLISGIDNGTVQARAAEVRSNEVMFKPFGIDDLVRKIDNLLARSSNGTKTEAATAAPPARVSAPVSTTPVPASNGPSSASTTPAVSNQGLKERLQALAGTPGIRFVVLTDREGFLIETAGELSPDADEVAGALASCLAEASDGIGRELGQGRLVGTILEYESGTLLLHGVGPSALLAVLVGDQGALGKVRYYVRKEVPELVRAL